MQLWNLFRESGVVGQLVLVVLLFFSLGSWAVMLLVGSRFRRASRASRRFLGIFRRSRKLSEVQAASNQLPQSPLAGVFRAAYAEIEAQSRSSTEGAAKIRSLPAVERALLRASRTEAARLARYLGFLATTASATPFIGLFGTVWGIMNAFTAIGLTGNASIVSVAPGIAEALINTAAGLFAAIPALVAYNAFTQRVRRFRGEMEEFSLELLNLTERTFS